MNYTPKGGWRMYWLIWCDKTKKKKKSIDKDITWNFLFSWICIWFTKSPYLLSFGYIECFYAEFYDIATHFSFSDSIHWLTRSFFWRPSHLWSPAEDYWIPASKLWLWLGLKGKSADPFCLNMWGWWGLR